MSLVIQTELTRDVSPTRNRVPSFISSLCHPRTPESHCSICLEEITNRCFPNKCFHMFCYECLKRWASIDSSCPLCKKKFGLINHSLCVYGYEVYDIAVQEIRHGTIAPIPFSNPERIIQVAEELYDPDVANEIVLPMGWDQYEQIEDLRYNGSFIPDSVPLQDLTSLFNSQSFFSNHPNIARRINVYRLNIWAFPLSDLSGQFRECSSTYFRRNPAEKYRLYGFIVREIVAISSFGNMRIDLIYGVLHILSLIMGSISTYEITDTILSNMLEPFLGYYTAHFCHELYNFAKSPFEILGYDINVYYIQDVYVHQDVNNKTAYSWFKFRLLTLPPPGPIDIDSDDSFVKICPEQYNTIETTSSNDSDVEIIDSFTLTNLSRDLPSTSTGIRDSLDHPNRHNLRRRRLSSPILNVNDSSISAPILPPRLPGMVTRRTILDSSSSDEDSEPVLHGTTESGIARRKKRKTN